MQVAEEVSKLACFKKGVREIPIYGGQSYDRQLRGLREGAQIIIGTPGRVMDHLDRRTLVLDQVKMIVLDEADRMLDMGFLDDIRTILKQAPAERQTVFFSATMPRPIQELIRSFTRNPVNVTIETQALTMPDIDQVYYEVDRRSKLDVLCRLIDLHDIKFSIIFCATKMMVDELTEHLAARGYAAVPDNRPALCANSNGSFWLTRGTSPPTFDEAFYPCKVSCLVFCYRIWLCLII